MVTKEDLEKNIKNFINSAKILYEMRDYLSSSILYFKALFAVIDYILLTSGKGVPKDHSERFRMLQNYSPRLYTILDKLYPTYRATYTIAVSKENCNEVKKHVEELIIECKIKI